jgi:hypothetical protein
MDMTMGGVRVVSNPTVKLQRDSSDTMKKRDVTDNKAIGVG